MLHNPDMSDSDSDDSLLNFLAAPLAFGCSEPYQFEPQLSAEAVQKRQAALQMKKSATVCGVCLLYV